MGFQVVINGEERVFVSIEEIKRLVLTIERKEATSEETGVDHTKVEIETRGKSERGLLLPSPVLPTT